MPLNMSVSNPSLMARFALLKEIGAAYKRRNLFVMVEDVVTYQRVSCIYTYSCETLSSPV